MESIYANSLIEAEEKLNEIFYNKVSIGGLLAKYNESIYNRTAVCLTFLSVFIRFCYYTIKYSFVQKNKINNLDASIFLSKITNKPSCARLIDPIKSEFKNDGILFSPDINQNEVNNYLFFRHVDFKSFISIFIFILRNKNKIINAYKKVPDFDYKWSLLFNLFIQLIALENWILFFSNNKFKLVVVDFDRDNKNSPLVLAAKKNDIYTITLQHGVINPPYGYFPVLAEEIWVYGSYSRSILIEYGVNPEKIKVVGNPIAVNYSLDKTNIKRKKKSIGVALNPTGGEYNIRFLEEVFKCLDLNQYFNWIIKLHPSMKKDKYLSQFERESIVMYGFDEISNKEFFQEIDLLIVGNSGLGYEALSNYIPILVYWGPEKGMGHDKVMVEKGDCPEITNKFNYQSIMNKILTKDDYLDELLLSELEFLNREFYYAIGAEAEKNIIDNVKSILNA
jgi:hypothetical protein